MAEPFKGFDEIKRQFPSAEHLPIPVSFQGPPISLLGAVSHLIGKINRAEFRSKGPQTMWFAGTSASSTDPVATFGFVHRPEGWNTAYREETGRWEEIVLGDTGKGPYDTADFTPLEALIGGDAEPVG